MAAVPEKGALEQTLLQKVGDGSEIENSIEYAESLGVDHGVLAGVMNSLAADGFVEVEKKEATKQVLTAEGLTYAEKGSPEFQILQTLPVGGDGVPTGELMKSSKLAKIGLSKCIENGWVERKGPNVVRLEGTFEDGLRTVLSNVSAGGDLSADDTKMLKKRKLMTQVTVKWFAVKKGPMWAPVRAKAVADLTKEMLDNGSWAKTSLKPINLNSIGVVAGGGNLHPLMRVRMEFRKILIGMGFEEMPTNQWVESSFWNFDALFQPQQHPARDAHDTFFLSDPSHASLESVPAEYIETVKRTHESGGWGSIGYRYDWSLLESKTNILRTHTTAVSTRMLYMLANQPGGFKPQKYFSIDRVFRNETIDATHLAEFHQVEGLVADYNLSLGDLIGVIKTFFEALGIRKLRFKPAYNPYTEPSMEVFGYHPVLKKWTEIGNSGMFRPEMLRPMGLPEGVRVIAWGLSLERPTMIKYRINKITSLFGHRIDIEKNRVFPIARFP